jgi:hypothetical protein
MPQIINENPGIGALLGTGLGQGFASGLQQLASLKTNQLLENYKQQLKRPQQEAFAQAISSLLGGQQQPNLANQVNAESESGFAQQSPNNIPNLGRLDEKQALELAKLGLTKQYREKKLHQEENKSNIEFNKDVIKNVREKGRSAREVIPVLKRDIELSKRGKIRNPLTSSILNKLGLDFEALQNGDTLEMQKLQNYVLRGASKTFGGKVSNFEAMQLLKGFPNIFQSDEGRIQLAEQLLRTAELEDKENKAFLDIVKKNGNKVPFDLEQQLEEKMRPEYEKYTQEFVHAFSGKNKAAARFDSLPDAKQYDGKKIRDTETGQVLISKDGKWVKE